MFLDRRSAPPLRDGDEAARDGEGPPPSGSADPDSPADLHFVAFATHVRPWRPADVPPDRACDRWRRGVGGGAGRRGRVVSVAADGFPATRRLRVFTFDPAVGRAEGSLATARVDFEPLEPGPKGRLLEVVDDAAADAAARPSTGPAAASAAALDLDHPGELASDGRAPSVGDRLFHRQMVYAVAMRTWQCFREALGRDPVWGFDPRAGEAPAAGTKGRADRRAPFRLRLRLLDDREPEANAWYDPGLGEIAFGSFPADEGCVGRNMPGGRVHTCLSHDIVAHETAHALVDGMRRGFQTATNPDVPAFHEALADLVALFQHFTYPEVVAAAMARGEDGGGSVALDPLLATLARQFGQGGSRPLGLRTALEFLPAPRDEASVLLVRGEREASAGGGGAGVRLRTPRDSEEPHLRGAVLVAAVFEAFAVVLERRVRPYRRLVDRYRPGRGGPADPDLAKLVAEQACRAARQFLSLCVRAVDYCPPVDVTFGDYLRAMVTADADLVPDDEAGFRDALIGAFARRRIFPGHGEVANLSEDELLWRAPRAGVAHAIKELHFARLRFAGDPGRAPAADELHRQARAVFAFATRGLDARTGARLPRGEGGRAGETCHFAECGLWPWAPAERPVGDEVERPRVVSVRTLRRVGPDREVRFGLVAEVVQTRWHRLPDGRRARFPGGAAIILGPEGEVRYIVRKSLVREDPSGEARRMSEFAAWMTSGAAAGHWAAAADDDDPGGRLDAARDALRRLHGRRHAAGPTE